MNHKASRAARRGQPENLQLLSATTDELKVIDFGYARRYHSQHKLYVKYCTPEYASPEVANGHAVTPEADLWSVGIIAYILISGISPFYCDTPRDTLLKVQSGDWQFDNEAFNTISKEAKDFITKLLIKDHKKRISASEALRHPFINLSNHRGLGDKINLQQHRAYLFRKKCQCGVAQVKTVVQPRPLSSLLSEEEASSMPAEPDLPPEGVLSPAGSTLEIGPAGMLQVIGPLSTASIAPSTADSSEFGREYEDEDTWYQFNAGAYDSGPDTHLLPTVNTSMSMRMAQYRRSGDRVHTEARPRPSMKERRDLRDLSRDEALLLTRPSVWQLRDVAADSDARTGFPPIFKEKLHDKAYDVGDSCTMPVHVIGKPRPVVTWYRNDESLTDGGRVRTTEAPPTDDGGHYSLTVLNTLPHDFGVYKCVARNRYGTVTCRARMLVGDIPSRPGRPHVTKVSDHEAHMLWEEPETDGNSYIIAYRVDWHRPDDERWSTATYSIDECALVKNLKAMTTYRFRVAAINKFGISPYSWASVEIKTKMPGCEPLAIDAETKKILLRSRQATTRPSPETSPVSSPFGSMEDLSQAAEQKKKGADGYGDREIEIQEVDPATFYEFGSEIWRGRFSLVRNVRLRNDVCGGGRAGARVAKVIPYSAAKHAECLREHEMLRGVRQQNIVRLRETFVFNECVILVLDKLYGENVARSLSLKNKYNEYHVTFIIKQVLDALQFLHHRGLVHLNLQPDNVIMVSRRRFDVKLIDFGRARKLTSCDGERVSRDGTAEYMAPEKAARELVGVAADIWGIGVLAFILLSGVSPFAGDSDDETFANIRHVRYDAHQLYHNVTKHALRFLLQTLKANPVSRLTTVECLEHRWLQLNPALLKQRKAAVFSTDRLRAFEEDYISRRMTGAGPPSHLIKMYGASADFTMFEEEDEDYIFTAKH